MCVHCVVFGPVAGTDERTLSLLWSAHMLTSYFQEARHGVIWCTKLTEVVEYHSS